MNQARLPQSRHDADPHRPLPEFWGPIRTPVKNSDGSLQDIHLGLDQKDLPDDHQSRQCPICASPKVRGLGVVYGYPIFNCLQCDVGFVWPQPSAEVLKRYYGPAYWQNYMGEDRPLYDRPQLCDHIYRHQARFLQRLLRHEKRSRILDVGAGDGAMLRLLQDDGYKHSLGLDLDARTCANAQERLGVTMQCRDFLQFTESGWDAITLWAVIEHLKNPSAYVAHAHQLLKPGGHLVLLTGDNNSLCARLQGCFDMWMYPPEHLFFFGKRSLRTLLHRAGFRQPRARVGCQATWKESILTGLRVMDSIGRMLRKSTRPSWRSSASNLLVAWGRK